MKIDNYYIEEWRLIGVTEFVLSQKCMGLWYSNQQILGMKSRTGI